MTLKINEARIVKLNRPNNFLYLSKLYLTVPMKSLFLIFACLVVQQYAFAQPLGFTEFGSEPAFCRTSSSQMGFGVVYAAAIGGTPDYTYLWTDLQTGATSSNTTWGGLNPGFYEMTVTDDGGNTLTQVIEVDSLNPIAYFSEVSGNVMAVSDGWVGFSYENVLFSNESENYANPNDPYSDTAFFWQLDNTVSLYSIDPNEEFSVGCGAGTHQVCLTVITNSNCADTLCKQIHIFGPSGIEDETDGTKFVTIYSDHQQNILHVNCAGFSEQMIVEVFSVNGQQVALFEASAGNTETIFHAVSGVYLYTIKGQSSQEILATGKLIH